jgi:hypothetical protein
MTPRLSDPRGSTPRTCTAYRPHLHCRTASTLGRRSTLAGSAPGTEPVIRAMGEGDDRILIEELVDGIVEALAQAAR